MITISYALTPSDLEEARNHSAGKRVAWMVAAVLAGLLGLLFIYEQVRLFRGWDLFWKFWPGTLTYLVMALYLLWAATDFVGLQWFMGRYTGLFAPCEVCFMGDTITISSRGKKRTWRWLRDRGLIETSHLFLLRIQGSDGHFIVPKRAFLPEQERDFHGLLNPPKADARFVLDFFLTEADVEEVNSRTRTWLAATPARLTVRVICGLVGISFLIAPSLDLLSDVKGGWPGMWRTYPLGTVFLVAFCFLELWIAAGQPALKRLGRFLNHYDQRRTCTFSHADINVRRGDKSRRHLWKYILNFRETPNAFILRKPFLSCFIIPKSALGPYDVEEFRRFLLSKLLPA